MHKSEAGSGLADELAGLHLYHQLAVVTKVGTVHSFCMFFGHVNSFDRLQLISSRYNPSVTEGFRVLTFR